MKKGRDILKNMVTSAGSDHKAPAPAPVHLPHKPAGAIRAMNMSLNRLGDEAAAAKELRSALAAGDTVIELEPGKVEASFIQDRIPTDTDATFDELLESIKISGQQVPILVRPHPTKEGEYQAAYGHRRLRAALILEQPVKAVVRQLSDNELITAQGQENGPRLDLSFIERSLFAKRLEQHGLDRERICQTLSVDMPEVSRLLQVAEAISDETIVAIGPAPKVGRPRWVAFVELLKNPAAAKRAAKAIEAADFLTRETNERFAVVWKAVQEPKTAVPSGKTEHRSRKGLILASIDRTARGAKIAVPSKEFAQFLDERMGELVEQFERQNATKNN